MRVMLRGSLQQCSASQQRAWRSQGVVGRSSSWRLHRSQSCRVASHNPRADLQLGWSDDLYAQDPQLVGAEDHPCTWDVLGLGQVRGLLWCTAR